MDNSKRYFFCGFIIDYYDGSLKNKFGNMTFICKGFPCKKDIENDIIKKTPLLNINHVSIMSICEMSKQEQEHFEGN